MTESTGALAEALAKVQATLPKLERDRVVTVQTRNGEPYSYSYATLANLSEAVLPLLAEHGLAFTALPGAGADGKMCLRYMLLHTSGESISGEFPLSGEGGIQQVGGRVTYARRYCLAAVVGIAADEDDESRLTEQAGPRTAQRAEQPARERKATAQRNAPPPPLPGEENPPDGITKLQLGKLHAVFGAIGWTDRGDRLRAVSAIVRRPIGSASELTKDEASGLIDALDEIAGKPDPSQRLTELLDALVSGGEG